MRFSRLLLVLLTTVLSSAACSFDYAETADTLADEVPDTVLTNVTHTVVRDGAVSVEIRSARVENFSNSGRAVLHDVTYTEYDAAGAVANVGSATRATFFTETEDAQVSGSIELRSEAQETSIRAEQLTWEDQAKRLSSGLDQPVSLERDDGSQVTGRGFEADLRRQTIRFDGRVAGTLVTDEDSE